MLIEDPLALLYPAWVPSRVEPKPEDQTFIRQELRGNDVSQISSTVRSLAAAACELGVLDSQTALHVQIALEEALTNAMIHGNLEVPSSLKDEDVGAFNQLVETRRREPPYAYRVVILEAYLGSDGVKVVVRDDGPGFDVSTIRDPSTPENIGLEHGRGIAMMRSFMDRVKFNSRGNAVMMMKYRTPADHEFSTDSTWAA